MRKPIQITIPTPCHENWDEMAPADKGRYCASCQKNVIDFTKASDREIAEALRNNKSLCGRFSPSQLERDLVVPKEKSTAWTALAAGVLSFVTLGSYKATAQETVKTEQTDNNQNNYEAIGILTGVVSDKNDVLADVSIINKTKNDTTVSLLSGDYEILANEGDIIEFSLYGYEARTITVKSGYHKNIKLKRDKSYLKNISEKEKSIITGIAYDEDGYLPGINVLNKNSEEETIGNEKGNYTIAAKIGDIIEFRFVGYISSVITIGENDIYDIKMIPETQYESTALIGTVKYQTFFGRIFHSIGNLFR